MNRKKSIIKLSFIVGALIVMLVFAFLQAGKVNTYMGFPGTMVKNMGAEGNGGVVVVYKAEATTGSKVSFARQLEARLYYVRQAVLTGMEANQANYPTSIGTQGSNKIRIETTGTSSHSVITAAAEQQPEVVFTASSGEIAFGSIIRNARIVVQLNRQVLEIEVTDEG